MSSHFIYDTLQVGSSGMYFLNILQNADITKLLTKNMVEVRSSGLVVVNGSDSLNPLHEWCGECYIKKVRINELLSVTDRDLKDMRKKFKDMDDKTFRKKNCHMYYKVTDEYYRDYIKYGKEVNIDESNFSVLPTHGTVGHYIPIELDCLRRYLNMGAYALSVGKGFSHNAFYELVNNVNIIDAATPYQLRPIHYLMMMHDSLNTEITTAIANSPNDRYMNRIKNDMCKPGNFEDCRTYRHNFENTYGKMVSDEYFNNIFPRRLRFK